MSRSVLLLVPMLCACASTSTLYEWGDYRRVALLEARGSLSGPAHAEALRGIITRAETTDRVPPGLYAEYGFALLELGDRSGAAEWFAKERARWPESAVFMDRLIAVASGAPAAPLPPVDGAAPVPPVDATPPSTEGPVMPAGTPE